MQKICFFNSGSITNITNVRLVIRNKMFPSTKQNSQLFSTKHKHLHQALLNNTEYYKTIVLHLFTAYYWRQQNEEPNIHNNASDLVLRYMNTKYHNSELWYAVKNFKSSKLKMFLQKQKKSSKLYENIFVFFDSM